MQVSIRQERISMLKKKSYLISRLISGLGNSLYGLVFIWWLQVRTTSSTVVGVVNALFTITAALAVFYGPIIDNLSYKKTSIYAMVIQVVLTFLLALTMSFVTQQYFWPIVIAVALSICDEFFSPADRAILKDALPTEAELTKTISQVNIVDQLVQVGGTALSGVLLALMTSKLIIFLCAWLSLLGLIFLIIALRKFSDGHVKQRKQPINKKFTGYWQQVISGFAYIKNDQFLFRYFWSSLCYSFAAPALVLILPKIAQQAGHATLYSTFYIVLMLGFILGALLAGKLAAKTQTIAFAWLFSAFLLALVFFAIGKTIIFSILLFLFACVTSIHNVLGEAKEQAVTSNHYLARVMTTIRTGTQIGGPIASVLAGILLDHGGQQFLLISCACLILCGGINLLFVQQD